MKRARKSSRVSWAPASNLCQVKLFLSEDCPSKVGLKSQDHLQAKTSSMLPSSTNEYIDLPPGFEDNHFRNQSKAELSHISQIKWECPPMFTLSHHWCVAAGEESREKLDQKLREMKVLEAVYPRLSSIPPSPSVSYDVEKENYEDNHTPLISIVPIEEEDSMDINPEVAVAKLSDTPTNLQSLNLQQYISATSPIISQSNTSSGVPLSAREKPVPGSAGVDPDLAAASALLAAAIMKNNEQGNPIDMDLLVKIFNDPIMVEKLIHQHGTAAAAITACSNAVAMPTTGLKPASLSVPLSKPAHDEAVVSGPKQATLSGSMLMPTPNKPAVPSVPVLRTTLDAPATPSVPFSRPVSGKLATPSVTLPIPPTTPSPPPPTTVTPHMHRPVDKNVHPLSNGVLPTSDTQPPQQDTVMLSGIKRAAPLPSVSSSDVSTVPLHSASVNLHAGVNQVRSTASTTPHQPTNGSTFAVKDANYYKNLIRQHGADAQDSLIGIHHNNFQDLKPVHNNFKQREVIYKNQKPCIYFNSSRGCRNGSNCPYQHDMSAQWGAGNVLGQNAKRMKLGPEINGRI